MSAVLKPRPPRRVIYQEVEFDIQDFDDEDLVAELERRKGEVPYNMTKEIDAMFVAMQTGERDTALTLLREYLMTVTGRILP